MKHFSKKIRGKAASAGKAAKVRNGRPEGAVSPLSMRGVVGAFVIPVATTAMLVAGAPSAHAASYFTAVSTSMIYPYAKPIGANYGVFLQTGLNNLGNPEVRTSTAFDDVIFNPSSWTTSNYTGASFVSNNYDIFLNPVSTTYTLSSTSTPSLPPLELKIAAGANAINIYKAALTDYYISAVSITSSNDTLYLSSLSSLAYTANLTFDGGNRVQGYTDIDSGKITINGDVYFAGTVQSGNIDINTTSTVTFNSDVDLSSAGTMRFYNAGNVILNGVNGSGAGDLSPTTNSLTGNVDFHGQDGTLTLSRGNLAGNIDTNIAGTATLVFGDSAAQSVSGTIGSTAALKEIKLNGTGAVTLNGSVKADQINYNTATTLNLNGDLETASRKGSINFNNHAGTLNIANGVTGYADIVSTGGTNGIINFAGGGERTYLYGNIGTSASNRISDVNIGTSGSGWITMGGNLYATTLDISSGSTLWIYGNVTAATTLNYNSQITDSTLRVFGGDVTGNVASGYNERGLLVLAGGTGANGAPNTQVVYGTVGDSVHSLWMVDAGYDGMITNFTNTAPIYSLGFDVSSGTANLSGGLVGRLIYYGNGTVNIAADKNLVGNVVAFYNDDSGILTLNGGTQTVSGNVGASDSRLHEVDANVSGSTTTFGGEVNATTFNAAGASGTTVVTGATNATTVNVGAGIGTFNGLVTATTLNVTTGTANLNAGLTGNLDFDGNGLAVLATGQNLTGDVTNSSATTRGTLTLSGDGAVTGSIGSATNAILTINAGATGTTARLNTAGNAGMTYASTLQYTGNGTVLLNGQNIGNAVGGLVGTVDFGTNGTSTGTLQIADNVNLTTGANGIQFRDANGAALRFLGTSTVTGVLGASATGATLANSTLKSVYAGATDETVTFNGDVHVSGSTFHVSNNGTVNLNGDLFGPLVYDSGADGTVNVANGKSIRDDGTAAIGTVTTVTDNSGTLNYLGGTTLSHDLGTNALKLKAVRFHSDGTVAAVSQNIGQNVYAYTTTIGNATTATTANITATNLYLGNSLTLAASNVTLNTAGTVAPSSVSPVDFGNSKNANGTLTNTATVTKSTIGTGAFTTNGATLNFVVGTQPWAGNAGGLANFAGSSSITGGIGSSLVMNGSEKINLSLLGSLRNGAQLTLVDVGVAGDTHVAGTLNDNSYVIDTVLSRVGGDLVVTAVRNANTYITKSGTAGHFSNNAASSLGALAAAGTGYSEDMQTVLNKLDIDQWGYGNNAANLANQVELLAPVANASVTETTFNANTLALDTVEGRLAALRGDVKTEKPGKYGAWLKGFAGFIRQSARGIYDGYRSATSGTAIGADSKITDSLIGGISLAYSDSQIDQRDFRNGDRTTAKAVQGAVYSSLDVTDNLYLEGTVAYTHDQFEGQRKTAIDRRASSDFNGSQLTGRVAAGYHINLDSKQTLTPMLSMQWSRLNLDSYTETGADALNLKVDAQKLTSNRLGLGVRYNLETRSKGLTFRPEISGTWFNDSGDRNKDVVASYVGGGSSFATPVVGLEKNSYNLGAGLSVLTDNHSGLALYYDYTAASNTKTHGVQLVGRVSF